MPRYDQHFLRSEGYIRKIIAAVLPQEGETLLEIGPGRGALTQFLLELPFPYIGVEIDPRCLSYLHRLSKADKARWIQGDFLKTPLPTDPLYIVSNLPYSITGPALFRILGHRFWIREGVLMLQAEVAQRLYARVGERTYGRISVLFQSIYRVKRLFRVPPGAFLPPPKIWSEVVVFSRAPHLPLESWDSFADFVKQAFRQPRQTLGRNLRDYGMPPSWRHRRPHELSIGELVDLWRSVQSNQETSRTANPD
ncbi:MAG: 16S rRNA (adenine(1518)-N(6)/adenine(1519)-N(6))-dimethyltransferase RsmA [Bacteroidia bacterium]|nr:16S rRNA (adenine(1518)-N(6)/adenine(1519)-N(6))-dimethyltransferase RsmA [Bacteroidia bacterium]